MSTFLTVALIHLLAVASPGPDFAIVVQQSLTQSRRITLWIAAGIALGILLHVTYSLLGIGLLIAQSVVLYTVIKLLGAGYLLFIGWKALRCRHAPAAVAASVQPSSALTPLRALRVGFLCNALNPKVTLFFLALFTQVIAADTPILVQAGYGLWMSFATFAWFALLGSVLTTQAVRRRIGFFHVWAERLMGAILIAMGIRVALSARN
jgi:RhtB (resistance to homoserine/threonine) family protein